jgi:hypothetical protein
MNGLGAEVEFAANEAMLPSGIDGEAMGQEAGATGVIGTADEDDLGVSASRQAIWRPREARGRGLLTRLGFEVMSGDEAVGPVAELGPVGVVEAFPDFGLPQIVEGLDLVLEAMLAGWGEDGGDPQGQAEEGDGTEAIGMVMGTMKAQIVIELSVGGQPVRPPVGEQRILGELGGDGGGEETAAKAAVQGDGVEDLNLADALDDESLDDIEGVQLDPTRGHLREVPTGRRWGAAGQWMDGRRLGAQGAEDGDRAIFAQGIEVAESVAQTEDVLDDLSGEGVGGSMRAVRTLPEIDPVESVSAGSRDPVLDVGEGEPEPARDLPQAEATPREQHQLSPMGGREFFTRGRLAGASRAASFVPASLRSASTTLAARDWAFVITDRSTWPRSSWTPLT